MKTFKKTQTKNKAGRPEMAEKTISKTYRFFEKDVLEMLNIGKSPKELFRLGILALNKNPQMIARIREIEDGNNKLQAKLTQMSIKIMEMHKNKEAK